MESQFFKKKKSQTDVLLLGTIWILLITYGAKVLFVCLCFGFLDENKNIMLKM